MANVLTTRLLVAVAVIALACRGDDESSRQAEPSASFTAPEAPPIPASPVPASPTATPPRGVEARVVRPGLLRLEPAGGPCGRSFMFVGQGFEPNQEIVLLRWVNLNDTEVVARTRSDSRGEFSTGPVSPPAECGPGSEFEYEARVARASHLAARWPRAVFYADQLGPLILDPPVLSCGASATLRGGGFPPGATVQVFLGDASTFAHNFGHVVSLTADSSGSIETVLTDLAGGSPCTARTGAIFARVDGVVARWKTVFRVEP